MGILPILIGWPLLIAAIVPLIKQERIRGYVVYAGAEASWFGLRPFWACG